MQNETKIAIRELVKGQCAECHAEGMRLYAEEDEYLPPRLITLLGETYYRLCHQDFCGLSTSDAAEVMDVDPTTVLRHLVPVREEAPQLFPILPQRSAKIYFLFTVENMTASEIAYKLCISIKTVNELLWRLYKDRHETGLFFRAGSRRRIAYEPWMDSHIKQEF